MECSKFASLDALETTNDCITKKLIGIDEFMKFGYLQEVNRRFFHPLGLALAIEIDADGNGVGFSGIVDHREDPEGMTFSSDVIDKQEAREKCMRVSKEWAKRWDVRNIKFGEMVQTIPTE